jgi:hypothetical protein
MKRAAKRAAYRQPLGSVPVGITVAKIDADSGLLAGPFCTKVRTEYFLQGTAPHEMCDREAAPMPAETLGGLAQGGPNGSGRFFAAPGTLKQGRF